MQEGIMEANFKSQILWSGMTEIWNQFSRFMSKSITKILVWPSSC